MTSEGSRFERRVSGTQQRRLSAQFKRNAWSGPPSDTIYAGISGYFSTNANTIITIAVRDATYLLDFFHQEFTPNESQQCARVVTDLILDQLKAYAEKNMEKFVGLAMPRHMMDYCPTLCSRLWAELDIIPLVLSGATLIDRFTRRGPTEAKVWEAKTIDEQAESMARKCVRLFGPENIPLLQVGLMGAVEVDTDFHVRLATLDDFKKTVSSQSWSAVEHYASDLKQRKVKLAFFSATPQGGGVALMRHAMVRFSHYLGTDLDWYVPKPRPGVFRITKTNHNILQGVSHPDERLTEEHQKLLLNWTEENAKRHWTCPGGPLRPPSEGGADVIVVDDPQMPGIIPLAKQIAPDRPVVFRSHIQIRSDLVAQAGSPQAEAWGFLWNLVKHADIFISHPVGVFVPRNVPQEMVGYVPASTDWLDGLNKNMRDWDVAYYGRVFNSACRNSDMPTIEHPDDQYIIQVARFDPSKGIIDVLDSYQKFHDRLRAERPALQRPKLLVCGHGSVDDPDATLVYDQVVEHIEQKMPHLDDLICAMRLKPSDQVLNAVLSKARIVLQLSTREGFEVKVSEAIHKGKPVIASRAGGIPLQVENGKNGFLVDVGDTDAVAQHLYDLWTDEELYRRMSDFALNHVYDEVSTVGNTLNWLYLASKLSRGHRVLPHGRWINDMAFEELGVSPEGRPRLTREVVVEKMG